MSERNTWPGGTRHAMSQSDHARWNASHHPGTRQTCELCDSETERCEEDSLYTTDGIGPLCPDCYAAAKEPSE